MAEKYIPTPGEMKKANDIMTYEQEKLSELRESAIEAIKNDQGGFAEIESAKAAEIPEEKIKEYAFRVIAADLHRENGNKDVLEAFYRLARNSKVMTEEEVREIAKPVYEELYRADSGNADAAEFLFGHESPEHQKAVWIDYERNQEKK